MKYAKPSFIMLLIILSGACGFSGERQSMDHFRALDIKIPATGTVRLDARNETVIFLRGENLSESLESDKAFAELRDKELSAEIAMAFLAAHHRLFKLDNPFRELKTESVTTDDLGYTHVKFQQMVDAIPILNAEIIVHLNRWHQVNTVNGSYIPTPSGLDTTPALSREAVEDRVAATVADKTSPAYNYTSELTIYAAPEQAPRLAYRVAVHSSVVKGGVYIVDARTGDILTKFPTIYDGNQ